MTPLQTLSAFGGIIVIFATLTGSIYGLVNQERDARRANDARTLSSLARLEDQSIKEFHRLQDDIKRLCK